MRYLESLTPAADATAIYTMDVVDDTSPFDGDVCGLRYLGDDFRVCYLGFPLYFMQQDQARALAQQVIGRPRRTRERPTR